MDQLFTIQVNNSAYEVNEHTTLAQLLEQIEVSSQRGIAVALNGKVVRKDEWCGHELNADDSILIITAAQGG